MHARRPLRAARSLAPLAALAALGALACGPRGSGVVGSFEPGPDFQREAPAFDSAWEIVGAIENGTFAERAGLQSELAAARARADRDDAEPGRSGDEPAHGS